MRLRPAVPLLLAPGEKQISPSTPTAAPHRCQDAGTQPSQVTVSGQFFARIIHRHRPEHRTIRRMFPSTPGSAWGWCSAPTEFAHVLSSMSFLAGCACQDTRGQAPFSPPKGRAQKHINGEHSKGGENNTFLSVPTHLAFIRLVWKMNHINCILKKHPGLTTKLLI